MFNLSEMMNKLQEMQQTMAHARERLNEIIVEGESGGGMVRVTATAAKRVQKIHIDAEAMQDTEMLEDLICAAVNAAMDRAEQRSQEELQQVTGGMLPNLPGMDLSKFGL